MIGNLLGRRVLDEDTISIQAIHPSALSGPRRKEIASQLLRYFAEVDANRQSVSAEEADEILNEAVKTSLTSYRSR